MAVSFGQVLRYLHDHFLEPEQLDNKTQYVCYVHTICTKNNELKSDCDTNVDIQQR